MNLFLGIDFGTSTNVVTSWKAEKKIAEPVPLGEFGSPNIFSNVIYYESASNKIAGDIAVDRGKKIPIIQFSRLNAVWRVQIFSNIFPL